MKLILIACLIAIGPRIKTCLLAIQQIQLMMGHSEASLVELDDVNEGGNWNSMYSELWFSNAFEDWQVENKMDCSKHVDQMFDEANLKILVEMLISLSHIVCNRVAQTQLLTNLQPPRSICNSK